MLFLSPAAPLNTHLHHYTTLSGRHLHCRRLSPTVCNATDDNPPPPSPSPISRALRSKKEGPSTDINIIFSRLQKLALPYWTESEDASAARWRLAGVLGLTLGTTGVSVLFNYLGRDFFNALSAKDEAKFTEMLIKWLIALAMGIPVFVLRDYYQSTLSLEWRKWMTEKYTKDYLSNRSFYRIQADNVLDNPDQRIAVDIRGFTDTALGFGVTMLNASVDLISFSGILFSIYPPLFAALLIYSIGGTAASIAIGKNLVGLNFAQEAQEANFRYGLVRVRENAESVAFYSGEAAEGALLNGRLQGAVQNFKSLLMASRNLNFFTSFYRFLIQILPAAVVAPLYFRGEIEFGVINQSSSAFNHILTDVSLVVYQFEAIAGFSAVIDRLGEFSEVLKGYEKEELRKDGMAINSSSSSEDEEAISLQSIQQPRFYSNRNIVRFTSNNNNGSSVSSSVQDYLLKIDHLSLTIPTTGSQLIHELSLQISPGHSLLIMGPSGCGKTSLLRSIAGLWLNGTGNISLPGQPVGAVEGEGDVFFVPQRPYLVLGTLRDQLLYPAWQRYTDESGGGGGKKSEGDGDNKNGTATISTISTTNKTRPSNEELEAALSAVSMTKLLDRVDGNLDASADWSGVLSLGEQQRLAIARVLLAKPKLALLDEATSALDTLNEMLLYRQLSAAGVTCVSVGHRPTLIKYHERVLFLGQGDGGWEVKQSVDVDLEKAIENID